MSSFERLAREAGFVYKTTEEVTDFFGEPGEPCILVSASCDFSLRDQDRHHPNADLEKLSHFPDYGELAVDRNHYRAVQVGPACNDKCHPGHRYVLKSDRHAVGTFNDLPTKVAGWFTTNLDVAHPRINWLPFGINDHGPGHTYLGPLQGKPKRGLLYVNFSYNTMERGDLKRWAAKNPWVTLRDNADLPVQQYLAEVAEHKFVLCPFGNGLDCYRTYESIYLGALPLVPASFFSDYMLLHKLPVYTCDNYYGLTADVLEQTYNEAAHTERSYRAVTLSYWRACFARQAEILNKRMGPK